MSLVATALPREFVFEKGSSTVRLPDPNPDMSVEDVLTYYAPQYPELTTALIEVPKIEKGKSVYKVTTTVGTNA
jgi:PRTRC genetic system protein C